MKLKNIILTTVVAFGLTSAASAATFFFGGNAGPGSAGNSLNFNSSGPAGISVTVTAWTFNGSSYSQVALGQYSPGLGVINGSNDNSHAVDNSGNIDFLRFAFSSSVIVSNVTLGWVDDDSDFRYWGTNSGATSTLTSGGTGVSGGSSPGSFNINASGSYLWIGANPSGSNDAFKVLGLTVSNSVPDGGQTALMLGMGFLALAGLKRRFWN